MAPTDLDKIRRTFLAFRESSIWVQTCFNTFRSLYHGGPEIDSLLHKSAAVFFEELNIVLIEYWITIVCRLTDPACSKDGANLTVAYLVTELKRQDLITQAIEKTAEELNRYRKRINQARNKLVSHADRTSVLKQGIILGEHTEEELEQFVQNLQQFNDLVGEAIGEGPLDYQVTSCPGDVYDLLKLLSAALNNNKKN